MTHPPPDPEGRRQQDEHLQLQIQGLAAANVKLRAEIEDLKSSARGLSRLLDVERKWTLEEAAARLDAALATKDAGEAVERAWALVRELRGEC